MNLFAKFTLSLHRITGTVIALFFLMWFVTGLVLIYHPYPRLSDEQTNRHKEALADSLPDVLAMVDSLRDDTLQSLAVYQHMGRTIVKVATADSTYKLCADTAGKRHKVTFDDCLAVAERWLPGEIPTHVDTLNERAQWVLYERYERVLPIYKLTYDDAEKHELFVSGKTGEVQQLTTADERLWAWIGAIPHKFYYPFIRRNVDVWKAVITVGGILCLLAALTGFGYGVYLQARTCRRKGRLANPYKKFFYRWHFALGLVFGIFLVGWGISGSLAMQKVPKWLVPYEGELSMHTPDIWKGDSLCVQDFKLDYRSLRSAYPELKSVEWLHLGGKPVYSVVSDSSTYFVDASDTVVKPLHIDEEAVYAAMKRLYGDDADVTVELLTEYDEYYTSVDGEYPLPVYLADMHDADGNRFYISRDTDYTRFFNRNKMARKWLFGGLHYLNFNFLTQNRTLWLTCLWLLCLGGIAVSFTGVVLGVKYIRRNMRK